MKKAIEILEDKVDAHQKALNSWEEELLRPDLKDSMRNFLTKQIESIKEFINDLNDALSLLKGENAERQTKPASVED